MSRRTLNLVAVAAAAAVLVWVVSGMVAGGGGAVVKPPSVPQPTVTHGVEPEPTAAAPATQSPSPNERPLRGYALALPDVDGLPPDLQPGDRLQLWVAWDPPLTDGPEIEILVPKAIYERTVEPVLAGEPPTAVVLVPDDRVADLMYGDRYGSLSASLIDR